MTAAQCKAVRRKARRLNRRPYVSLKVALSKAAERSKPKKGKK